MNTGLLKFERKITIVYPALTSLVWNLRCEVLVGGKERIKVQEEKQM